MSLKLERSNPSEWLINNHCDNQVTVRLEGEAGLGVCVPVSLLVADSRLARAVLSGHQAGLVTLAQVEADTLRLYSQILRTGATEIRAGDRRMREESVGKLRQLLKMLDSQIVLDHGRMGSNSRMEENTDIANISRIFEEPGTSRKRHKSLTGSRTHFPSRQTLNFDSDSNNNDEEDQNQEDIADQRYQMLTILREEKRKSFIPPLSPALSSSTFKSPVRPRTPGPASKTNYKKAGSIFGTQTFNSKSLGVSKSNRRQTIGGISQAKEKTSHSDERTVSGYHNDNDWMPNFHELDPDIGTARSSRSEPKKRGAKVVVTTGVVIKEEKRDDGYETLTSAYDEINDVEVIASIHTCPTCNKEFDSRDKMKAHVSKTHSNKNKDRVKHYNCPYCAWTTIFPGSLKEHIVQSHKIKNKVSNLVCGFCSKKFSNFSTWEEHITICVKRNDGERDVQIKSPVVSTKIKKTKVPSTHHCLDCFNSFSSRALLMRHKSQSCVEKPVNGPPFICKHCNAIFTMKKSWALHVKRNCSVLKEKRRKSLNCSQSDSEQENLVGQNNYEENENLSTDLHGDPEDTREDHVSCKECGHKLFTQENFERHQQQTGHTGETIRLPSNLSI